MLDVVVTEPRTHLFDRIYSFSTGNWTSTEALPQALYASSSTLLGKDMVVAGGFANFGRVTDIIRYCNPTLTVMSTKVKG